MVNIDDEIMQMVTDNLHITYTLDDSTERRLQNEIGAGIEYIQKYCDPEADFSRGTKFGSLLCDYVLRAEAGAADTFGEDFAVEITGAKIQTDVDAYAEAMGYAET
jgi:hypothetical protein